MSRELRLVAEYGHDPDLFGDGQTPVMLRAVDESGRVVAEIEMGSGIRVALRHRRPDPDTVDLSPDDGVFRAALVVEPL